MKQGLFRRIFVLYGVILLLSILGTEAYITGEVRTNTIDTMRDNLSVQGSLMAGTVSFQSPAPLDSLCTRLKQTAHARVTVIALNGRVLGDSDTESAHMANHGDRIEVQQAKLSGSGMTIRHSDTLGYDFLYVAKMIELEGVPQGFIRLSVPLKDVDTAIEQLRIRIILVVAVVLLATGILAFWQIDRLRRLTNRIRTFSSALARGEVGSRLFISHAGEFDEIAESLNTMSEELKRSITASEEEKHRLSVILRSIPDALFIIDNKGVILFSSAAARELFSDTPFSGRPYIEVVRNSEFLALMEEVQKQRKTGVAEMQIDSPLEQYCIVHVSPLSYSGAELSGFVAVFHDITQLKRLEQTRKDFVANISHEIKTPITAIMGFAETLLDGALDDRQHLVTFLQTIRSNSERINNLVEDLLTISKIELGVTKVDKAPLDVEALMEQVVATLGEKASEKNLALAISLDPRRTEIKADRDRLLQILTNLADNAIKFTEKGRVTLGTVEEDGRTCLYVEDTGIGIPPKHLPRIGERFYRVDPGRSRNMGGTGLGFAIVKHLVKAHGWDIRIRSTPGKGTKVIIYTS
jgi:two-component system phosphate regulon sensor histidine kinase PhoR